MNIQPILAALSGQSLVSVLIWLIVAGVIFWLVNWLIDYCQIPQPFNKVAKVIIAVVAVLILINALLMLAGHPLISWP